MTDNSHGRSRAQALFQDRREAGRALAAALGRFRDASPLVLALPRGGVPVAYEIAEALRAELDLLLVRKIGAPGQEELGLGSVVDGDDPQVVWNDDALRLVQPTKAYLAAETSRQLAELERRRRRYFGDRAPADARGRTVILVDDGVATGGTVRGALRALRHAGAARVVLAVPVAPRGAIGRLRDEADDIVVLQQPEPFQAVGLHYADFDQTSDDEVIALIAKARDARRAPEASVSEPDPTGASARGARTASP